MFFDVIKHSFPMKRIKLNLAAIAFLLGTGIAVASTAQKANVKWGLNGSTYVEVTGNYNCIESDLTCTRTYPQGQNPNINPSGYLDEEVGTFAQ
ncbi:hypothetical protein SRABI27_00136 [Pedobacter sp. Bi27]|jgi:hypothetical protein|nr:hypothetical protein SRABI27_00136 [Pedobacter sp. Bi27]CAH0223291.1 hypothetical protein SRABI36_02536 [Pedobacter sp. Bi36]